MYYFPCYVWSDRGTPGCFSVTISEKLNVMIPQVYNRQRPTRVPIKADFRKYLKHSEVDPFVLNLRDKTLMEVIEVATQAKSKRYPKYRKQVRGLVNNLKLIEKNYRVVLMPIQITDIFWDYFISFCSERGLKLSSINTLANQLRAILNWAVKYDAKVSPTYADVKVKKPGCQAIALTADELSRIKYFDIDLFYKGKRSDFIETMHKVRDMFILSCNLYQRHSDMVRISRACFRKHVFKITQQKTGNIATVKIDKYSIDPEVTWDILHKYNYEAPYDREISNYNKRLHLLMRDIGFTDTVRIEERIKGELVTKEVPKWKLISSHTARRTAITTGVLRGINVHNLKQCSGHTDLRVFDQYVRDE